MYSYRCLCRSLNRVALLIKCCITVLYENFYCCQKAVGCLAWKGLWTHTAFSILSCLEDSETVRYRRNPFSFFQRSILHPIVLIIPFVVNILLSLFTFYHYLLLAGGGHMLLCWWVSVQLMLLSSSKTLSDDALQGRWQWVLTSLYSLLPQKLDFLGWRPEWTVAHCSDGDICVRSPWRLPRALGGDSLLFIVMLF